MTVVKEDPRVCVITGAAGGIGRVIARMLAEEGYRIVAADIDADRLGEVVDDLGGEGHTLFAGDLTRSDVNAELVAHAREQGVPTVVVNAVGISPKADGWKIGLAETTDDMWKRVFAVNVDAPFYLVRAIHQHLPDDGTASIVNLLSITSRTGAGAGIDEFPPYLPSTAAYAASKAALMNLTATWSRELARQRVRVNGIAPGFVQTAMMSGSAKQDKLIEQLPIKRFAKPEEVAAGIRYLVSADAAYVNGATLDMNGGWFPA
jgi:3-oxoacyl-[acyl-carrier protein] reductase